MPDTLTQDERLIAVQTPLGKDYFLLTGISGHEAVSQLFEFDLDMISDDTNVDPTQLVGENVSFLVEPHGGKASYFNGFISHFYAGEPVEGFGRRYHARIVPWLWFLTRAANCRIFQQKTVIDILKQVFSDHGFSDFKFQTQGNYQPYEYKVQYDETDFNFVSRLLEHEGIFYFFKHENGKHTAIFGDARSAFQPGEQESVSCITGAEWQNINAFQHIYEFRPGKWTLTDFNFEQPQTDLTTGEPTVVGPPRMKQFEFFEYPGAYDAKSVGAALARTRIEMEEAEYHVVSGGGMVPSFRSGETFSIKNYDLLPDEEGKKYALLSVRHSAVDNSYTATGGRTASHYSNSFTALPADQVFRPPRHTPTPLMHGPQTATVVGPSGEEIYTDKYGRVKVQFRWDRYGKADENSSMFIRVGQSWASKQWGGQIIPRVGMEVIVEFLEGDPDEPIITGCFYNAGAMPPDTLPDNKTRTVFRTHSSPNASGFNELSFEDKAGSEQIFLHGEYNQDIRIKNDAKEWIGSDRHLIVVNNQLEKVSGDKNLEVGGDQKEQVQGTVSLTANSDLHQKLGQNFAVKAGMAIAIEAGTELTLKVGSNFIDIGPAGIMIVGSPMVMINSGGSPGPLTASPESPQDPKEADNRQPGSNPPNALTGTQPDPGTAPSYVTLEHNETDIDVAGGDSPQAQAPTQAAQTGAPFCAICAAAAAAQGATG
jgi:type VI secretion system secreted protein VgrG